MSRMTNVQEVLNQEVETEGSHNSLITASNDSLFLGNGCSLAIIDKGGKVVQQGSDVNSIVFEAVSETVIRRFCNRFTTFTEADFKQLQ